MRVPLLTAVQTAARSAPSCRRPAGWTAQALLPWLLPALLLSLWLAAVHGGWMSPQILPAPTLVLRSGWELAQNELGSHILASLWRLALGLLAGSLIGLLLGAWTGLSRRAEALLYPSLIVWAQIPNLALIPLLMIYLGIGDGLQVVLILNAALVPVFVHCHAGLRDVAPQLREVARVLRLRPLQRLRLLYLPGALPALLTGLRLALSACWKTLVVVELLASSEGIGYLMVWGRQMFQLDIVFVGMAVIGLLGLAMEWALQQLDERLLRWPRPALARHQGAQLGASVWPWLLPVLLAGLWWQASTAGWIDNRDLPSPGAVWSALQQGLAGRLSESELGLAMTHSLARYAQGLLWGALAGLLIGLACGLSRMTDRLLAPSLNVLRQIAVFAWLPLLTAWAGNGEAARVLFIAIASFFPIFFATHRSVLNLPAPLVETARVLRLGPLHRLHRLVLPGAASGIFAGLRLALVYGWLATIGAEYFMASSIGIGSLMINAQQLMNVAIIFAGLLLVSLTGALLNAAGRALEDRLQRWRYT
jgi:sulfonate transport system permease protein